MNIALNIIRTKRIFLIYYEIIVLRIMHTRDKDIAKSKEHLSGQFDILWRNIKIDCYVLDNCKRVLAQRGI